jgi:hypothetical protein
MLKMTFQVDALCSGRTITWAPDEWALVVHQQLNQNGGNITYLTDLASYYLSYLVIARKLSSPVDFI